MKIKIKDREKAIKSLQRDLSKYFNERFTAVDFSKACFSITCKALLKYGINELKKPYFDLHGNEIVLDSDRLEICNNYIDDYRKIEILKKIAPNLEYKQKGQGKPQPWWGYLTIYSWMGAYHPILVMSLRYCTVIDKAQGRGSVDEKAYLYTILNALYNNHFRTFPFGEDFNADFKDNYIHS